ncbi:MAG: methyltransferase domain-containing protein [Chloroflexi bacterium]|nr:methyltransferase domain-containing protein [Chloroflexota bacterium]
MIIDLGCGDGRGALALAAADPGSLVLAVDAVAAAMAETSRRAARSVPNLLFIAASAEAFGCGLPGIADRVVVSFPWGSLLRGLLGLDPVVGEAVAGLLKPGGRLSALVSVTPRDRRTGLRELDAASAAVARPSPDLRLVEARPATREEILVTRSTWGRRLIAGQGPTPRLVWRLEWRRAR